MSDARARQGAIAIHQQNPYVNVDSTYDIDLLPPSGQFEALVNMIEAIDAAYPPPYTQTPPWGEPTPQGELTPEAVIDAAYMPTPQPQGFTDDELLTVISDAYTSDIPEWNWENDPQYYGLGVPPGVPNFNQPFETGHSQIVVLNPAAENGWDEWSGKPKLARVARHENDFKGYNAGTSRGHMVNVAYLQANARQSAQYFTQQHRDLLLATLQKRGLHGYVVQDVPQMSYTDQVQWVDPATSGADAPYIGEEGIL